MQKHIETNFNVKCSRASLSRRMADMGFSRGIIRRGFRSTETTLPQLSQRDYERIAANQAENEMREQELVMQNAGNGSMNGQTSGEVGVSGNNKKTKYAWLTDGEPVRKPKRKKSEMAVNVGESGVTAPHPQNEGEVVVQPDLESMGLGGHMDGAGQEDVDLQRLGHEAQDRIAQSQYPLPIGQQNLPPLQQHHDGYSHPHSSPYMYRPEDDQHQLPQLEGTHNGFPKRVSFSDQYHHQGP